MTEDYYTTLGVVRNATTEEIKAAYLNLARKFHPDKNPDDKTAKEKFQKVQAAFDVLSDPKKRELFDRYGSSFDQMGPGSAPRGGASRGGHAATGFEDFDFSQFFGDRVGAGGSSDSGGGFADIFKQFGGGNPASGSKRKRSSTKGEDLHESLEVPFQTAVTGGEVSLALKRPSGKIDTLAVKIPAGIDDGAKIRLREQGNEGSGKGKSGDILLTIRILAHPFYARRGNDLTIKVPITLHEAVLGGKVEVPTPHGVISLRVPAGTSSGKKLRLKGKGVQPKSGDPGDLLAEIQIVLSDSLDERTISAIREFEIDKPTNLRGDLRW